MSKPKLHFSIKMSKPKLHFSIKIAPGKLHFSVSSGAKAWGQPYASRQ